MSDDLNEQTFLNLEERLLSLEKKVIGKHGGSSLEGDVRTFFQLELVTIVQKHFFHLSVEQISFHQDSS